jgi:ParB-like chromosome segregation protein Spo0J
MTSSHIANELKEELAFEIRINPEYEKLVSLMTMEAFDSLISSIRVYGQHEPITINDKGEILDGYHRFSACKILGIELKYDVMTFDNPSYEKLYVIDVNLQKEDSSLTPSMYSLI